MSKSSDIEDWAWAQPVSGNTLLVLLQLAKRADWDTLECYPSQKFLAGKCKTTDRTVRACLKELEVAKIIRREHQQAPGGLLTDLIILNAPHLLASEGESTRQPRKILSRDSGKKCAKTAESSSYKHTQEHFNKNSAQERETDLFGEEAETTPPAPSHEPPAGAFELFWREYPRKTAIGAARASFAKAWPKIPMPKLDPRSPVQPAPGFEKCVTLMRAIDAQKGGWTDPKFIPHASTWLNQERWADEVGGSPSRRPTGVDDWQ